MTQEQQQPPNSNVRAGATRSDALRSGAILPTLARLTAPNVIAMTAVALVSIAETAYIGRLGAHALAGVALVFPIIMLMQMISAGAMGGGISSAISRALGAGDTVRAQSLALCALVIGLAAGVVFAVLILVFGPLLYRALGAEAATLSQAKAYSHVAAIAVFAIWVSNSTASALRGSGRMAAPSAAILTAGVLQIAAGGVLGFGLLGLPPLGVAGIAAGQVVAFSVA